MDAKKHRIKTPKIWELRDSICQPTSTEETTKDYIFIVWECNIKPVLEWIITWIYIYIYIYRQLNYLRVLVQIGMDLSLLY